MANIRITDRSSVTELELPNSGTPLSGILKLQEFNSLRILKDQRNNQLLDIENFSGLSSLREFHFDGSGAKFGKDFLNLELEDINSSLNIFKLESDLSTIEGPLPLSINRDGTSSGSLVSFPLLSVGAVTNSDTIRIREEQGSNNGLSEITPGMIVQGHVTNGTPGLRAYVKSISVVDTSTIPQTDAVYNPRDIVLDRPISCRGNELLYFGIPEFPVALTSFLLAGANNVIGGRIPTTIHNNMIIFRVFGAKSNFNGGSSTDSFLPASFPSGMQHFVVANEVNQNIGSHEGTLPPLNSNLRSFNVVGMKIHGALHTTIPHKMVTYKIGGRSPRANYFVTVSSGQSFPNFSSCTNLENVYISNIKVYRNPRITTCSTNVFNSCTFPSDTMINLKNNAFSRNVTRNLLVSIASSAGASNQISGSSELKANREINLERNTAPVGAIALMQTATGRGGSYTHSPPTPITAQTNGIVVNGNQLTIDFTNASGTINVGDVVGGITGATRENTAVAGPFTGVSNFGFSNFTTSDVPTTVTEVNESLGFVKLSHRYIGSIQSGLNITFTEPFVVNATFDAPADVSSSISTTATGIPLIKNGSVFGVFLTNQGSGYGANPTVTYTPGNNVTEVTAATIGVVALKTDIVDMQRVDSSGNPDTGNSIINYLINNGWSISFSPTGSLSSNLSQFEWPST